ncbi:MAG: VUT family protein [Flavobacteriales bacterium TMED288]|nr:hypothetical protein [Flavobacteriales bacterium]RPG53340.1 MAG: VUT family protein [Flavobacteriales bacterium TMED288]|tara:strand:- start:32 stop:697 length:666 start_codon:yes stop_codon:yes gene_type:complete
MTKGFKIYIYLAGLFIASLIICNLIANKFITVNLGFKTFTISAGILPYPITFLITDLLSEIYGIKSTRNIVWSGFFASIFVLIVIFISKKFNSIPNSPVDNETFNIVFGNSWRIIFGSMTAYLFAQFIDIKIYHFWKKLTNGNHLWLRNNFSTIFSQLVDTSIVVTILFINALSGKEILYLIIDGWIFKMIIALIDTPILYLSNSIIKKYIGLKFSQEFKL